MVLSCFFFNWKVRGVSVGINLCSNNSDAMSSFPVPYKHGLRLKVVGAHVCASSAGFGVLTARLRGGTRRVARPYNTLWYPMDKSIAHNCS